MVMSWIWTGMVALSILSGIVCGRGESLSAAVLQGAQAGLTLAISLGGSLCLWSGVGRLMEVGGITEGLARLLGPILRRVFPSSARDPELAGALSGNICANFLGLGNAATPMGIQAARRMARGDRASDELCCLIVLNTASIQLIPANVAAVRSGLGASRPFDILPAVWLTSAASAGLGVLAAWGMGKLWKA